MKYAIHNQKVQLMTQMTRKIHAKDDLVSGLLGKNTFVELISGIFI